MNFKIENVDCIKFIKKLKKDNPLFKFDAVITDPPYNISRKNNFHTIGRAGINFGEWDYNFDQISWIRELSLLIKDSGSIIIFNDYKNFGVISKVLEKENFSVKDLLRWEKIILCHEILIDVM